MQKWSNAATGQATRAAELSDVASHSKHRMDIQTEEDGNFIPFPVVRDFLLESKAFGNLRYRVRRLLLGHQIMDIIHDEVLRNLSLSPKGESNASFHVQWDLNQFVAEELHGSKEIGRVFTITGENINAFATSCKNYCQLIWGI